MINLAKNGVVCECGSKRLAPVGDLEPGSLVICGACARTHRVAIVLAPVCWSTVEEELEHKPHDLQAFQWTREGVPPALRRTLPEMVERGRRLQRSERTQLVLWLSLFVALALVILKAVHS